jgi:hypothetical protein
VIVKRLFFAVVRAQMKNARYGNGVFGECAKKIFHGDEHFLVLFGPGCLDLSKQH